MRSRRLIYALLGLLVAMLLSYWLLSSGASLSTDTRSSSLGSEAEKLAFLKRYLIMHSEVDAAEFHIRYQDNSGGLVPGPSEWDVQVVMKMPPEHVRLWTKDLDVQTDAPDLSWTKPLWRPEWTVTSSPRVYGRKGTTVIVFESEGIVCKRAVAN